MKMNFSSRSIMRSAVPGAICHGRKAGIAARQSKIEEIIVTTGGPGAACRSLTYVLTALSMSMCRAGDQHGS
jgi:hypothetical protein